MVEGRKFSGYVMERGIAGVETGRNKVERGLYSVELHGGNKTIANASFSYNDFGVSMILFELTAKAIDILLEKLRVSSVVWPPGTMEQVGTTNYPALISD